MSLEIKLWHSEPVYCSMWTASKTGTEMMTTSEDGAVKWWDIRNMEAPVSMIDITGLDPGQHVSPCMMEYEPTIPSRLLLINSPDITHQRDTFTVYTIT